jgi:geranylgeranyl diphosphate synthase type I
MLNEIKNKIEKSLKSYILDIDKLYSLNRISPFLASNIKEFVLRKGKRVRPILFVIGYLAFAKKQAPGLYTSAVSTELLHDFMLIHDDIIDKSDTRRGKPSMHKKLNEYLKNYKNIKFTGQDLSIVIGDILYTLAINAFLSIKVEPEQKEKALKKFIEAAFYTGCGEFIELLYGTKDIKLFTKTDIYRIYDLKTAYYSFAYPLAIGATLAGAEDSQIRKIFQYGVYLGRAFQIKDDILGIFADEKRTGKSSLSDLQEAKKTLLIWYGYNHSTEPNRKTIKRILSKGKVKNSDLLKIRKVISTSGALDYAGEEISGFIKKAQRLNASCSMRKKIKDFLYTYSKIILRL